MAKPILAIITDSIRYDNHHPLAYFTKFDVRHLYFNTPYNDLKPQDLRNAIQYHNFKDLENKIKKLKPDLIQGAEPYGSKRQLRICLLVMKISKTLNIPYFFPMLENRPVNERFGIFTGFFVKKILQRYAKKAKLIFYLNQGAKRNLLEVGADENKLINKLYGVWGIDTNLFKPEGREVKGKLERNYILFVGRFIEDKGIPYILAAWNSIKNKYPNIDLVFIGSGNLDKEIKGSQIKNLGPMKNSDLPLYFTKAQFSIYPSITQKRWEEQIGMVNLQSLACGTPVITTTSGAIPEYINEKVAILVPERDAKVLADAINQLLSDEKLRLKLARNSRGYILENYDAQKTVTSIEEILIKIL